MHPIKIKISLHVRAVWSESSLGAYWIAKDAKFIHVTQQLWSDCADAQAGLSLRIQAGLRFRLVAHVRMYVLSRCSLLWMFIISPALGDFGRVCFVFVAFIGCLHLNFGIVITVLSKMALVALLFIRLWCVCCPSWFVHSSCWCHW